MSTIIRFLSSLASILFFASRPKHTLCLSISPSQQLPLPNKSHSPLDIVNFQLSALQNDDMYTVFKYASPTNKAATGPWQRFGNMVRAEPYNVLVGHNRAEVLLEWKEELYSGRESYNCLVRVWSSSSLFDDNDIRSVASTNTARSAGISGAISSSSKMMRQEEELNPVSKFRKNRNMCEFNWILSKCEEREDMLFEGCWMVDGVYPR